MRLRVFVFACVVALAFATPVPARAQPPWEPPIWTSVLHGGPWGLASDAQGAVVVSDAGYVRSLGRHGTTLWETRVEGTGEGNPAITKSLVLVGATGRVVALARCDGRVLWEQPMDGEITSVALGGATALAGDHQGTLRAFGAFDGTPKWSVRYDGQLLTASRVDRRAAIVVAAWEEAPAPAVRGLDLATGALRWTQDVGLFTAAPGLRGDHAFIATGNGHFSAWVADLDVVTGRARWAVRAPASFSGGIPAVDRHDVVFVDQIGDVFALDPRTGSARWTRSLRQRVIDARVVLFPRRVVVRTFSGELFVLDRVSGRVVARADPRDFDGFPSDAVRLGRSTRMLVALRITEPNCVELWRVP